MIALRHIGMKNRITFEKFNLNHTYFFNDFEKINPNLLNINKKMYEKY